MTQMKQIFCSYCPVIHYYYCPVISLTVPENPFPQESTTHITSKCLRYISAMPHYNLIKEDSFNTQSTQHFPVPEVCSFNKDLQLETGLFTVWANKFSVWCYLLISCENIIDSLKPLNLRQHTHKTAQDLSNAYCKHKKCQVLTEIFSSSLEKLFSNQRKLYWPNLPKSEVINYICLHIFVVCPTFLSEVSFLNKLPLCCPGGSSIKDLPTN